MIHIIIKSSGGEKTVGSKSQENNSRKYVKQ